MAHLPAPVVSGGAGVPLHPGETPPSPPKPRPSPCPKPTGKAPHGGAPCVGATPGRVGTPKLGAVGEKGTPIALYIYIIYTYRTGWGGVWPPRTPKAPELLGAKGNGNKRGGGETKASLGLAPLRLPWGPPPQGRLCPPPQGAEEVGGMNGRPLLQLGFEGGCVGSCSPRSVWVG